MYKVHFMGCFMNIKTTTKKWILFYFCFLTVSLFAVSTKSAAASELSYYDYTTNSQETYNGRQVTYLYNSKKLELDYPGIIINGIALADAEGLFETQLGFTVTFNHAYNQISITDGRIMILMTPGSNIALVNGEVAVMNAVPLHLHFDGEREDSIYVPSRFVCETMGYTYLWNSADNTVKITETLQLEINGKNISYSGTFYSVTYQGMPMELGDMPGMIYDGSVLVRAQKVAESAGCTYSKTGNEITVSKGSITIVFVLNSNIAYVNGKRIEMPGKVYYVKNNKTHISYVCVPLDILTTYLGFEMSYSDSKKQYTLSENEATGNADSIRHLLDYSPEGGEEYYHPETPDASDYYFTWNCLDNCEKLLEKRAAATHFLSLDTKTSGGNIYFTYNKNAKENGMEEFHFATTDKFVSVEAKETDTGLSVIFSYCTTENAGIIPVDTSFVRECKITSMPQNNCVVVDFVYRKASAGYEYSLNYNEEENEVIISIFPNYLTKINAYSIDKAEVLELYGITRGDITDFSDRGILIFDMPAVYNCVGTGYYAEETNPYLTYSYVKSVNAGTKLQLRIREDATYHFIQEQGVLKVYIMDMDTGLDAVLKNNTEPPVNPGESQGGEVAGIELPDDKIIIPLPDNYTLEQVSDRDNYLNKAFLITLEGNQKSLFAYKPIINPYSSVKSYEVIYNSASDTTSVKFFTNEICGYRYEIYGDYLLVTVGKPREIYDKIVLFDAGHGGFDPGAKYSDTLEKDLNYKILNQYVKEYFNQSDIKLYYTRESDIFVNLYERAAFAKKIGADLFISLHMNANTSSAAKGTQVFYSTANNKTQSSGLNSYKLARLMVDKLSNVLGTKNRGATTSEFVVVKQNTVPAVLVELGFMSNASDYAKLTDPYYQKMAAKAIYDSVVEIFNTYPTKR